MKKKVSKRKGFTLVELLVVIAILAVLITVTVIGFVGFRDKAKNSNDQVLITQINRLLQLNETSEGKPNTMHEALKAVEDEGFIVDKLTPTSDKNDFLWDQTTNRFVICDEEGNLTFPKNAGSDIRNLWKIYNELPETLTDEASYNVYLSGSDLESEEEIEVKTGFDVGKNSGIKKIKYTGGEGRGRAGTRDIIRTNDPHAEVTIDNDHAEVDWYGRTGLMNIEHAASDSVHLYGKVYGSVDLKKGHLVLTATAEISFLNITADSIEDIEVDKEETAKIETIMVKEAIKNHGDFNSKVGEIAENIIPISGSEGVEGKVAYYNGKTYDTIEKALHQAEIDGGKREIILLKDSNHVDFCEAAVSADTKRFRMITKSQVGTKEVNDITIKLNGHELTFCYNGSEPLNTSTTYFQIGSGTSGTYSSRLAISNGKLTIAAPDAPNAAWSPFFCIFRYSKLELTNVYCTSDLIPVNVKYIGAQAIIKDCVFDCKTACIDTSSNRLNEGTTITIENSNFKTSGNAVVIAVNHPCNLTMNNCKVENKDHGIGILLRDGHTVIKDSTIVRTWDDSRYLEWKQAYNNFENDDDYFIIKDNTGPLAGLVLGNKASYNPQDEPPVTKAEPPVAKGSVHGERYNHPATCEIINSKIISEKAPSGDYICPAIHVCSSFLNVPTLTIDDKSEIDGGICIEKGLGTESLPTINGDGQRYHPCLVRPETKGDPFTFDKLPDAVKTEFKLFVGLTNAETERSLITPEEILSEEITTSEDSKFTSDLVRYYDEFSINDGDREGPDEDEPGKYYIKKAGKGKCYDSAFVTAVQYDKNNNVLAVSKVTLCEKNNRVKMQVQVNVGVTKEIKKSALAGEDYEYTSTEGELYAEGTEVQALTIGAKGGAEGTDVQELTLDEDYTVEGNKVTIHKEAINKRVTVGDEEKVVKYYFIKVTTNQYKTDSEANQIKAKLQGHMESKIENDKEVEVKVKDSDNNLILIGKLTFGGSVPELTYKKEEGSTVDLDSDNFKAAFDLADLEGDVEFDTTTVEAGTQINKITYKLTINGKDYTSDIVIAELPANPAPDPEPEV